MKTISLLELATSLANANRAFVLFDVDCGGSSSRFARVFPSLDDAIVADMGDKPFVVEFGTTAEARDVFNTACRDFSDNYEGLIYGKIALAEQGQVVEFDLDDDELYPVVTDAGVTRETITAKL